MLSEYRYTNLLKCKNLCALACITALLLLSACNIENNTVITPGVNNKTLKAPSIRISRAVSADNQSNTFYHTLVAELYQQQDEGLLAIDHYLLAVEHSTDIALLSMTTVLTARAGQTSKALKVAKRWVEHAPESLQAKQYLALLLLRSGQFVKSARALDTIWLYVDKESKQRDVAHQFISQLLKMESHTLKAFKTYQVYVKQYGVVKGTQNKNQVTGFERYTHQQLTLASLAMKARKYKTVERVLKTIKTEKAILIRSKALNKLGRTDESVSLLRPLVEKKETGDGLRFEFVRFLILADQKDEASLRLKMLVNKYPDNKDLLKSLVALNLDQKKWDDAEGNAKKMLLFIEYQSDARHFLGEIYEARGDYNKALASYLQVVDGKMIDSAQTRIPELLEKSQGLAAARLWLHQQRSELFASSHNPEKGNIKTNTKKKAALYKIEADLLFSGDTIDAAMEFYQRALVLDPENNDIRYSRGLVYEQQGQLELAEKDFQHILKIDHNDTSALNALGYMLAVHTQRFDEAHELIKKAYRIDPKDAAIIDSLGWLYFKRGEIATAERYLRKAFKGMKQPEIAGHLIEVLQKQGQQQEARVILMQMLQLFPDNKILRQAQQSMFDI